MDSRLDREECPNGHGLLIQAEGVRFTMADGRYMYLPPAAEMMQTVSELEHPDILEELLSEERLAGREGVIPSMVDRIDVLRQQQAAGVVPYPESRS